jgi:multidrug efflux pump subunit AcrB
VLCDFIAQLRKSGMEKTQAVIEAGIIRLRPVLLTAVTTVLGLIPLTLGINLDFFAGTLTTGGQSSQFWYSMGVAVIAGLTVATVLTLVIVPVTYHSLDSLSGLMERLGQGDARRRREATSGLSGAEIHARRAGEEAL